MKNLEKIIGIFFVIGFLNTIIFIEYLKTTNRSGGEVGMMPIGIMIACGITLIFSSLVIGILKTKKNVSLNSSILIYHIIYFVVILYFGIELPELTNFSFKNIDLFIILIALFVWILAIAIAKLWKKNIAKKD